MNDTEIKAKGTTEVIMQEIPMKFLTNFRPKLVKGLEMRIYHTVLAHTQLTEEKMIDKCAEAITPQAIKEEIEKLSFLDRIKVLF